MKKSFSIILILTLIFCLALTSCGTTLYEKPGITFELPSRFEQRSIEKALYAYGDDESFVVFNKRTRSELQANGLSVLDAAEFAARFLTQNEMSDAVQVTGNADRAEFSYVVADPDNSEVYYYYYTLVLSGTDCLWIVQMACYEPLTAEYLPEFDKWARSITVE